MLDFPKTHTDYLSLHVYVGNPDNDFGEFLTSSLTLGSGSRPPKASLLPRLADSPTAARSTLRGMSGTCGTARVCAGQEEETPGQCPIAGRFPLC